MLAVRGALILFWGGVVFFALLEGIPDSPLALPARTHANVLAVIPQGWTFFTRDAREPRLYLYERSVNGWARRSQRNASVSSFYGLKRSAARLGVEMSVFVHAVPDEAWKPTAEAIGRDFDDAALPSITVKNAALEKTVCGAVLLEQRPPVPWAWAKSADHLLMPGRVVKLNVECDP